LSDDNKQGQTIGIPARWRHCIFWRCVFLFVLCPCTAQAIAFFLGPDDMPNAMQAVAMGLFVGLATWAPSPAALRQRLAAWLQQQVRRILP